MAPLMLVPSSLSRKVMDAASCAAVAGVGLAVVLLSEVALDVALEASGIAEARAPRSVAERAVGLPLLLWLAALPLLLRR